GVLKPDVVFFGETVRPETVEAAWGLYEESELLLVVGSSLAVFSGRRFVYRADREGVPVAVVNLGRTRADEMARVKVEGKVGELLPFVADRVLGERTVVR
ncbi:MAG: Sir2 family NAD-dependent protein deacetylase, partial [Gemmatimonadota bacterium]